MQNLVSTLSEREKEVFDLLLTGAKSREIAGLLCVALQTVKYHITNIYAKLGVTSRAEAVIYGLGDREIEAPAITNGQAYTETQIRAAASLLVEKGLGERKKVNELVIDLLSALGGKL